MSILSALDYFRQGMDTLDIARLLGRGEHDILREINQQRSALLGRRYPYLPRCVPSKSRLPETLTKRRDHA